jgi:hypothetical protein
LNIEQGKAKAYAEYGGERYPEVCPYKSSCVWSDLSNNLKIIKVPLWFDTEEAARAFMEKATSETERVFYLIQEFSYHCETVKDQAKVIFSCKSDDWPTLDEGKTERAPGVWAHVRSIFICDQAAAEDYVSRFNNDATAAWEIK